VIFLLTLLLFSSFENLREVSAFSAFFSDGNLPEVPAPILYREGKKDVPALEKSMPAQRVKNGRNRIAGSCRPLRLNRHKCIFPDAVMHRITS
jgi:hypothetical protein